MTAALITCLVALVLCVDFGQRVLRRRRINHAFFWALSFLFTFLAALMQLFGFLGGGFVPDSYLIYVLTAAAVPAVMGAGSIFLLWPRLRLAYLVVLLLGFVTTVIGAMTSSINISELRHVILASQQVTHVLPSPLVTFGFALLGSLGATALVLGALWSYVRTRQPYNLGLALGGIVFSLADSLAAYGIVALFFLAQVVGIVAIYLSVRAAQRPTPGSSQSTVGRAG